MPAELQQNIRILMYAMFGALGSYGVQTPDSIKTTVIAVIGLLGTYAWTRYGTRLNGLLEQVKEKTGVVGIELKVNPDVIPPADVNKNTSDNIVARPAA